MTELKQTAQVEILMSPILILKRAHQIVEHAYHHTAHFFMGQNDHHLGYAINFDYVSSYPSLLFQNLRMVVCVTVLFVLNTSCLHQ